MSSKIRLFDIAANLSDDTFWGIYHGKRKHPDDLEHVFKRAEEYGVDRLLLSSGHIPDALISLELCKLSKNYFTTIGCHPCWATEAVSDV